MIRTKGFRDFLQYAREEDRDRQAQELHKKNLEMIGLQLAETQERANLRRGLLERLQAPPEQQENFPYENEGAAIPGSQLKQPPPSPWQGVDMEDPQVVASMNALAQYAGLGTPFQSPEQTMRWQTLKSLSPQGGAGDDGRVTPEDYAGTEDQRRQSANTFYTAQGMGAPFADPVEAAVTDMKVLGQWMSLNPEQGSYPVENLPGAPAYQAMGVKTVRVTKRKGPGGVEMPIVSLFGDDQENPVGVYNLVSPEDVMNFSQQVYGGSRVDPNMVENSWEILVDDGTGQMVPGVGYLTKGGRTGAEPFSPAGGTKVEMGGNGEKSAVKVYEKVRDKANKLHEDGSERIFDDTDPTDMSQDMTEMRSRITAGVKRLTYQFRNDSAKLSLIDDFIERVNSGTVSSLSKVGRAYGELKGALGVDLPQKPAPRAGEAPAPASAQPQKPKAKKKIDLEAGTIG